MKKQLKIAVLKDRYPMSFMSPRSSRHRIVPKRFLPFDRLSRSLEGLMVFEPEMGVDLVHAQNRIPLGVGKFIINFESHLPRAFSWREDHPVVGFMRRELASNRCRRIIGMSHYAARHFQHQNRASKYAERLMAKLMVRYPNVEIPDGPDLLAGETPTTLRLMFVGGHFARKGGCVCVRVAEKAMARGLPIHVTIVSSLEVGGRVWTDPTREAFFEPYLKLLSLPNVTHHVRMANSEVREAMRRAHFVMLPTFADTFGFSAIEAMAGHTPVIATDVCALPEIVRDGANGVLLPMQTDSLGDWVNPGWGRRGERAYERHFEDEVERLSDQTLARLEELLNAPAEIARMRANARATAEKDFAAADAGAFWDALYAQVVDERLGTQPVASNAAITKAT